ncbi:MAG: biotin/lipoate A/B protein ligase family protein [Candidatus Altiarchaeota archaeon]
MRCRFIDTGEHTAYWNMGLDEGIMQHISEGRSPTTLRFYRWRPAAVSVGYFQSLREEVDVDACYLNKVDVVRRVTGGGAVYHDKELTYSFIAREDAVPDDILESYRMVCSGLIEGFMLLGIKAEFVPLNDIVVGGKKVSGNAQTRRMGCVLQHGTVLLDVDVDRMFSLLRVPSEKLRGKLIADVKERVTSVKGVLRKDVSYDIAAEAFKKGFTKALKLKLVDGAPSESEIGLAHELDCCKYSTMEWNDKR